MSLFTLSEVSDLLQIKDWRLEYLIKTGRVPKPRETFYGRRKFYTIEDVEQIRLAIKEEKKEQYA